MSMPRALAALGMLACIGCEPSTRYEIRTEPLQFLSIEFADSLPPDRPASLDVVALVGYVGCELVAARAQQVGNAIELSGEARCRTRIMSRTGAPAEPNPQRLQIALPPLPAGTYTLAGSDLRATLHVVVGPMRPRPRRFVTDGDIFAFANACTVLAGVALRPRYVVAEPQGPLPIGHVRVRAVIDSPAADCAGLTMDEACAICGSNRGRDAAWNPDRCAPRPQRSRRAAC